MSVDGLYLLLRAVGLLAIVGGPALLVLGVWGGGRLSSKDLVGALWLMGFGAVLIWAVGLFAPTQ